MRFDYAFTIKKDEPYGYLAQSIDFSNVFTDGKTIEECLKNAEEVLNMELEYRLENKINIPLPEKSNEKYKIAPSARLQSILLIKYLSEQKTSGELNKIIKTDKDLKTYNSSCNYIFSLKQLERAANALNKRLILSFE